MIGAVHVRNAFSCTTTSMSHVHLQIGIGSAQDHLQVTAFRSKITELRRGAADGSFRPDFGEDAARSGPLLLAETASLRDTSFAQIVRSIKRGIE